MLQAGIREVTLSKGFRPTLGST